MLLLSLCCEIKAQGCQIECEFGNEEWVNLGWFSNAVRNMRQTHRDVVTQVTGQPDRPIRLVKALDVQDQQCRFMPSGMDNYFPNVEGLQVANSELEELQSADMQQFPKLKQLFMSENNLQSLENNVFEHCPHIEYINLGHNKLKHMGTDIFAPCRSSNMQTSMETIALT